MKILFINYQTLPIPPVKGGAVEFLVDSFLKYNEEHHLHDITLYSIYDSEALKKANEYKYTDFRFIKIKGLKDKLSRAARHIVNKYTSIYIGNTYLKKILKCEKNFNIYDAIVIENAPEFGLKLRQKFKKCLILHLHNDYLNCNSKNAKKIFELYDGIYTISDHLGACVQTIAKSNKVKTLYNGINLSKFKENSELRYEMRKKYNIKESDFVFMYCGRIVPDKGVLPLVQAFSRIKKENVKLMIIGGIYYSNAGNSAYLEEIKKYTDENVIFTGFLPYEKMPEMYPIADVGVVPSIFNDPFNLTCMEFCANSIPVIISDHGAMKELVNNKCSVIAKYDENKFSDNIKAALELMLDSDIKEMGKEAKKVSADYSIEAYCENFHKLIDDLLK